VSLHFSEQVPAFCQFFLSPFSYDISLRTHSFVPKPLTSKKYDSSEPEELKVSPQDDIELVWVKIKTLGSNALYIGSFYKPPGRSDPQFPAIFKPYFRSLQIPEVTSITLLLFFNYNYQFTYGLVSLHFSSRSLSRASK
jgi:hypothetical protein